MYGTTTRTSPTASRHVSTVRTVFQMPATRRCTVTTTSAPVSPAGRRAPVSWTARPLRTTERATRSVSELTAVTTNGFVTLVLPPRVTTTTGPVTAAAGTTAVMCASSSTEKTAAAPPKLTSVAPVNALPESTTCVPGSPYAGATSARLGAGTVWCTLPAAFAGESETAWQEVHAAVPPACTTCVVVSPPKRWHGCVQAASERAALMSSPGAWHVQQCELRVADLEARMAVVAVLVGGSPPGVRVDVAGLAVLDPSVQVGGACLRRAGGQPTPRRPDEPSGEQEHEG